MYDEIIYIIREIITHILYDGADEYHVIDTMDLKRGRRIFRFEDSENKFVIIASLKIDTLLWKYCIFKNRKRMSPDDVLLLFAEMRAHEQLKDIKVV